MDLHQLKVFVSVFRNKSFSRASEELYLTQPTVSDHIKLLEEEFGCSLFDRLGRTIIPTAEAEVIYPSAVELLEKAAGIHELIGQIQHKVSGELRIGASSIPGTYLMPSIITSFQKQYPYISFQIVVSDSKDVIDKISHYDLLIGIVGSRLSRDQIHYVPLMEDELIVVSSPSFMKLKPMRLNELIAMPMVLREEGSGTRREMERILQNNGVSFRDIKIAGIFGSTDAVKQAVKAGLGFTILSKLSVADELQYRVLCEVKLLGIEKMTRTFFIATHKKRALPVAYKLFLEHLGNQSRRHQ